MKPAPYLTGKKRGQVRTNFKRRVSQPGQPPFSRSGLLKRNIFYGIETGGRGNVVIGPVPIRPKTAPPTEVPRVLEEGGIVSRRKRGKTYKAQIAARPYMKPAFEKGKRELPRLWADSVKPKR